MGKIMKDGQQYGVGGIQKAEGITYDNTDSGMTATEVQGAIDELNNGLMNKTIYSGAWITSSTSALHTKLTETLTLPKGIYLVILTFPIKGQETNPLVAINVNDANVRLITGATNYMQGTVIVNLEAASSVYAESAGSTSITYTYIDRGGIQAVRL